MTTTLEIDAPKHVSRALAGDARGVAAALIAEERRTFKSAGRSTLRAVADQAAELTARELVRGFDEVARTYATAFLLLNTRWLVAVRRSLKGL